jgi:hypothetical protein
VLPHGARSLVLTAIALVTLRWRWELSVNKTNHRLAHKLIQASSMLTALRTSPE